jgi:hypothetical protein
MSQPHVSGSEKLNPAGPEVSLPPSEFGEPFAGSSERLAIATGWELADAYEEGYVTGTTERIYQKHAADSRVDAEEETAMSVEERESCDRYVLAEPVNDGDKPPVLFGKGVVSTEHSRSERTRDSIDPVAERNVAKEAMYAAAQAQRKRLQKRGLKRPRPAADGYTPGNTPPKPNRWNRSLGQAALGEALEEGPAPRRRPLLTERQSQAIHDVWDMHEEAGRVVVAATMDAMFTNHSKTLASQKSAAESAGKVQSDMFLAAETGNREPASSTGNVFWLDTEAVREYRALKDKRHRDLANRRQFDGYEAAETVAEAA